MSRVKVKLMYFGAIQPPPALRLDARIFSLILDKKNSPFSLGDFFVS
jgi:hypothetical protein